MRLEPSAAVTVTVTGLLPETKPVRPEIATDASLSAAVAATFTALVPAATVTTELLTTV